MMGCYVSWKSGPPTLMVFLSPSVESVLSFAHKYIRFTDVIVVGSRLEDLGDDLLDPPSAGGFTVNSVDEVLRYRPSSDGYIVIVNGASHSQLVPVLMQMARECDPRDVEVYELRENEEMVRVRLY